jgi:hypothetical protein
MSSEEHTRTLERFLEIFHSLKAESDRGCVLVVGSMVERVLEDYISTCLVPKVGTEDELMGRSGNKPISGFSAKINLAYRIGLIPEQERAIYHQLRELRNACAHNIDRQDFVANHFKDRTRNIIAHSKPAWQALRATVAPGLLPIETPATVEEFVERIGWRIAFATFFRLWWLTRKQPLAASRAFMPRKNQCYHPKLPLVELRPNPSIEGTSTSGLRPLAAAPHVKR